MPQPFVHLHLHTEYSLLDGAVRIKKLMQKAARLEMPAVAMTDHGNLFGAVEFYMAAKSAGIKPIIGCEVYLAPGSMHERKEIAGRKRATHLTLLAKSEAGYHNLVKLVSMAHLEGQWYKPRIDKEALAAHRDGLICLSGCLNGEINEFIRADQIDQARKSLGEFVDIFGKDDFYLEMHDHGMDEQAKCNAQLRKFAKEFGLKPVAANDVHFLDREDHEAHDVMICIGTNANVFDENRMRYSPEVYFKSGEEMAALFPDLPEALENTLEIADKVDFEMKLDATSTEKYPEFPSPDPSMDRNAYFRQMCWEGLEKRYGKERAHSDPVIKERLEIELEVLESKGFVSYFLITWDFIDWAKQHGIPVGPGRGSAAGSIVAYATGITDICPLRFNLLFERFLNPERVSPPDIDVDFCQTRRPEVIDYVRKKYGERSVSHIVTFGKLLAKSVLRDVGRVMGMSYGDADRIAKMIPAELGIKLADARKKNPELDAAITHEPAVAELWRHATFLEGLTRGSGIHAAGVVIGDCDLSDHIPLTRGNEGEVVTQYAMGPLTEVGMLKMDFLGLRNLTVIQDAVDLIRRRVPDFDMKAVPLDDRRSFDLLNAGETIGVFQLESGGMMNLCRQFGVESIEHIIALIALYRPGPMDLIPDFIATKKGEKPPNYPHPLLEELCRETYGIMIYQEQVMQATSIMAGYSLGDADLLRRAMGKKKIEEMQKQRARFVEGCKSLHGIKEKEANRVFDVLEKFAGYGFNKSHSAAYAMVSYQTAYLKANYPVEFMAALLSNEINNTDKIAVFVNECKRMGIDILPPDANRSQLKFVPEDGGSKPAIRFGLAAVKNVGEGAMKVALDERASGGEFKSIEDFANRVDSKSVNKKILESLIKAGAFDFQGEARDALFNRVELIAASAASAQRDRATGQGSLFGDDMDFGAPPPSAAVEVEGVEKVKWCAEDLLGFEKELLGFYVTGHPLDAFRCTVEHPKNKRFAELPELDDGKVYVFAGLIADCQIRYTKRDSKPFSILLVEDFTGQTEVMVWSDEYAKHGKQLEKGKAVRMKAKVEVDNRSESKRLTLADLRILIPDPPDAVPPEPRPLMIGGGPQFNPLPPENPTDESPQASDANADANGNGNGNGNGDDNGNGDGIGWEQPGASAQASASAAVAVAPLMLRFHCGQSRPEDLVRIREIIAQHHGDQPVLLRMQSRSGKEITLAPSPRFAVEDSPALREKLGEWLAV